MRRTVASRHPFKKSQSAGIGGTTLDVEAPTQRHRAVQSFCYRKLYKLLANLQVVNRASLS